MRILKIKLLTLLTIIITIGYSQDEQTFGSTTNYIIECPCKLFKQYEGRQLFYLCEDSELELTYKIKEFKHKDGLDMILNTLDKNIYHEKSGKHMSDTDKDIQESLTKYLKENPGSTEINFMDGLAVLVDNEFEKKVFFSDEQFISSYEVSVNGKNSNFVEEFFNKSIRSLKPKRKKLKNILFK